MLDACSAQRILVIACLTAALGCDDSATGGAGGGGTTSTGTAGTGGTDTGGGGSTMTGGGGQGGAGGAGGSGGSCGTFPTVPGQDWQAAGPFETTELTTGPGDHFQVFQPATLGEGGLHHPIVVWCVGTGASPSSYQLLLSRFASHGFVVIAGDDGNQGDGDQALEGLTWLVAQNDEPNGLWTDKLDITRIGAAGHSQGGNAAIHVALKNAQVSVVLPVMPGEGVLGDATKADEAALTVPVFYVCGATDSIVPAAWCESRFANTLAPTWIGVLSGAGHFVPTLATPNATELRHWLIPLLRAELMDDCDAQPLFYDDPFALTEDSDWESVDRKNL